jgi:hypothetical protein
MNGGITQKKDKMDKFSFFNRRQFSNNPFGGGKTFIWQLDEATGNTAIEQTGRYNSSIINNVTLNQPGKIGTSFGFNGVDTRCVATNFSELNYQSYSCFLWIKANGNKTNSQVIISNQESNSNYSLFFIARSNGISLTSRYDSQLENQIPREMLFDNEWHRVCLVSSVNRFLKIYVDGDLKATNNHNNPTAQSTRNADLIFGARRESGGFEFEGFLDQVVMNVDNIVTEAEVLKDWNEGNGQTYI